MGDNVFDGLSVIAWRLMVASSAYYLTSGSGRKAYREWGKENDF